MHARQAAVIATLKAVQQFLDDTDAYVAPLNASGARKAIDRLVAQLRVQSIDQVSGAQMSKGLTARQKKLRAQLRNARMKPIAVIARALLRQVPEMHAFTLPPGDTPAMQLIARADGMADAASRHASVFIEAGLPADFLAQLDQATRALEGSLTSRAQSSSRSVGATAALAALVKQAIAGLNVLDTLVIPRLEDNDRLLGEWQRVRTIYKRRRATHALVMPGPSIADQTATLPRVGGTGLSASDDRAMTKAAA